MEPSSGAVYTGSETPPRPRRPRRADRGGRRRGPAGTGRFWRVIRERRRRSCRASWSVPASQQVERKKDHPHERAGNHPIDGPINLEAAECKDDWSSVLALSLVIRVDPEVRASDKEEG